MLKSRTDPSALKEVVFLESVRLIICKTALKCLLSVVMPY